MADLKNSGIIATAGKFEIRNIPFPKTKPNQALVKVTAISLNRGETRTAFSKKEEWIPGWDLAGEILQAAEDGSGPKVKSRVVGFLPNGSWAQYVTVPTDALAIIPDAVTDEEAATLPVAGLTALHTLSKGKQLLGKRVFITGATGGVGVFAVQLAVLSGADVTALVRNKQDVEFIKSLGADEVLIDSFENAAPFDLIIDSVGGDEIGKLIKIIKPFGTLVSFGNSSEKTQATYDVTNMYRSSITLYGFILFNEIKIEPASSGLARLLYLLDKKKIKVFIDKIDDWTNIQAVATELMDRKFKGKAVLRVNHNS